MHLLKYFITILLSHSFTKHALHASVLSQGDKNLLCFKSAEHETAQVIEKMTNDLQIYCRNKPLLQSTPHIGKVGTCTHNFFKLITIHECSRLGKYTNSHAKSVMKPLYRNKCPLFIWSV